jgi:hypothetical protein
MMDCGDLAMTNSSFFVVYVHRTDRSIFGAACRPVNENGILVAFSEERDAQRQCDRLNANRHNPHVFYSVDRVPVMSGAYAGDKEDIFELTPDLEVNSLRDVAA